MEVRTGVKMAQGREESNDGSMNFKIPKAIWLPIIVGLMSGGGLLGLFGTISGKGEDEYIKKADYRQEHFRDSMLYDKRFEAIIDSVGEGNKLIREMKNKSERKQK